MSFLMLVYNEHVPSCSYQSRSLIGHRTHFIAAVGDDLYLRIESNTVILMNVLNHCHDAVYNKVRVLEMESHLIFSELWYDAEWLKYELGLYLK